MKYKDYLILPVLLMFLIYASCAYINKAETSANGVSERPAAAVDPMDISWGPEKDDSGENWYAEGARGTSYFSVTPNAAKGNTISFFNSSSGDHRSAVTESSYVVSDMHMRCTNNGTRYDFIFTNEMTAYDTISGTYYQRGDYEEIKSQLTSGKFVNEDNPKDYYVLKDNGKSVEYFGDRVFKGNWTLSTAETISLYDKANKQDYQFSLIYDDFGNISGFDFKGIVYSLAA